jgi:micrococcal nuclease
MLMLQSTRTSRKKYTRYCPYFLALLVTLLVLSGCGDQSSNTSDTESSGDAAAGGTNPVTEETLEATDDPARLEAEEAENPTVGEETATPLNAEEELAPQGIVVTVDRAISGDTIRVSPAVEGERVVRLIGIDAPETGDEPFGDAARAQANSLIGGRKIALEFDTERTDGSGRLLAYARLPGGNLFNEYMLRAGYAQLEVSPPNVKYENELRDAQSAARESNLGIWALPPEQLCKLADRGNGIGGGCEDVSNAPDRRSGEDPQSETPVAGVPPVPPDGDYDCGHFNNQQQAQKVLDSDPSDPHDLDGEDRNGTACESLGGG